MKLIRNKADVGGLILLAVIALAGVALALAGYEAGLFVLSIMGGIALGMALVHFATRPRHTRKPVALVLLLSVPALFLVTIVGLIYGVEWLVLAPNSFQSPSGALFFGIMCGGLQVAFGRLMGLGPWAGD